MIEINIKTNDGKSYKFLEVNLKTIHSKIEAADVFNDGKLIKSYTFKNGEKPLLRRRTNSEHGVFYAVGFHKKGVQTLDIISDDGIIVKHQDRKDHVTHHDVSIEEHEV